MTPDFDQSDLGGAAARGVAWTALFSGVGQVAGFVATPILTRTLTPSDFGLIGMVTVFAGFAQLFAGLGLNAAVVQSKSLDSVQLSSVFWTNLALGAGVAGALAVAAPAVAWFYDEPRLVDLTIVIAAALVVSPLGAIHDGLLRRGMRFRALGVVESSSALVGAGSSVGLALAGMGVWSLALGPLAGAVWRVAGLAVTTRWTPRLEYSWVGVRDLLAFGANLSAARVLNYFSRSADNLIVGKVAGAEVLGVYGRAYGLMRLPLSRLGTAISGVMFPALSRMQGDDKRVESAYLKGQRVCCFVVMPVAVGLAVTADPVVRLYFGPGWTAVTPLVRVLGIAVFLQPIGLSNGWLFLSQGRADLQVRWQLLASTVTLAGFAVGAFWGALGVASSYAATRWLLVYPGQRIVTSIVNLRPRDVAANVSSAALLSLGMGGIVALVDLALVRSDLLGALLPLRLVVLVTVGVVAYVAGARLFSIQAYADTWQALGRLRAREGAAA